MNHAIEVRDGVLIVEDDQATAALELRVLTRAGVACVTVGSVGDALAQLSERPFSAVVLDYLLPDGDAWRVLDAAHARLPRVPVVVVTAMGNEQVAAEALQRGAADYLRKGERFWDQLPEAVVRVAAAAHQAELLRRRTEALAEAQQIAHLGSWEWNEATEEMQWSDELWRIFGCTPSVAPPTYGEFLARVHPEDRMRVDRAIRDRSHAPFEYRVVRPDGVERLIVARVRQATGIAQDVTDQRALENQLIFASRMASVGTLAAGVAHEINNPLSYLLINLELLADRLRHNPTPADIHQLRGVVEEARVGAHRVRKIVRGLTTFARNDSEQRTAIQLVEVAEAAGKLADSEIKHRARLVMDCRPCPLVHADESRLVQVVVNLLVNAAHAIPLGSASSSEVRVRTFGAADNRAIIEVEDTGAGIPIELQHRIFDPFFTTKPLGVGTGLGLSICHNIVTQLGGEISFVTSPRGTTFRVSLPAMAGPLGTEPPPIAEPREQATPRRARILVIDDDILVARSIVRVLRAHHDVRSVDAARDALTVIANNDFDIILCDLMMAEMSGMDLHAELARTAPDQAAKLVFITAGASTPSGKQFLERVPNERIEKPFDPDRLKEVVRNIIGS